MWEITEIVVALLLITLILMQERGGSSSGLFGGGGGGESSYQTRRGMEKIVFWATIVTAIAFVGLALFKLFNQ